MADPATAPQTQTFTTGVRHWKRYKVDVRVRAFIPTPSGVLGFYGRGSDISEGGMALFVPTNVAEGTTVDVEFTVPFSRHVLRVKAVVRNHLGYRYGVEFVAISTMQRQAIVGLCESLPAIPQ